MFTLNNPTDGAIFALRALVDAARAKHVAWQGEIAPDTGTRHLQGLVIFATAVTLGAAKLRLAPGQPHLEAMRGSYSQALEYVQKEDSRDPERPFESYGVAPPGCGAPGSRTDFEAIRDLFKEGNSYVSVADAFPGHVVRYSKGLDRLQSIYVAPRREKTVVHWYYGATGTGKSRLAFECYPDSYVKMGACKWWDGYESDECVIVDDYRCDLCTFASLLRLFDRYPHRVEGKGTSMQFTSKIIIVTAPKSFMEMWHGREAEDLNQLARRIEYIRNFNEHPWDAIDEASPIANRPFPAANHDAPEPVLIL